MRDKLQRIIFLLQDGRRKYATHNGQIEKWEKIDIASLETNIGAYGMPAYTADFAKYGYTYELLKERYPDAKIVRIIGFETEDHDLPLNPEVIF